MNHLVIYAHPNPRSFCHAILETFVGELRGWGHDVVVRDLYAMRFDGVLKPADFEAMAKGGSSPDVQVEQSCLKAADMVSLVYPVWWAGMPAVLKGYVDRVFLKGFAYDFGPDGHRGLLSDKKALLISTTGTPKPVYQAGGMLDAMNKAADEGIFRFCGMQVLLHKYFCGVPFVSDAERKVMLAEVKELARTAAS